MFPPMGLLRDRFFGAFSGFVIGFLVSVPGALAEDEASVAPSDVAAAAPEPDVPPIVAALNQPPEPQRGPFLLSIEIDFQKAISSPQNDTFGPGLSAALFAEYPVLPWLLVGGRLRGGFLFDGPAPADASSQDPGFGYQVLLMPSARFRPLATADEAERGLGFFADIAVGGGVADGGGVAAMELGIGYMFAFGAHDAGPIFRYQHIFHPGNGDSGNDASLLVFGFLLTLNDARTVVVEAAPEITWRPQTRGRDADHDGLLDAADRCPREAEDHDDFGDEDGCPDFDDDGDDVLDRDDACPREAEDTDDFEDEDGCPEPDNDADGVFDDADSCPGEKETINGESDEDGCPDEGVIALREGRFVLEDQALWRGNGARFGRTATRVVDALANVITQHPDWVSVTIESHVEARGNAARNQALTVQRAEALRAALIARGVPEARVTASGVGATSPRGEIANAASRRHRRVEVVIVAPTAAAPEASE